MDVNFSKDRTGFKIDEDLLVGFDLKNECQLVQACQFGNKRKGFISSYTKHMSVLIYKRQKYVPFNQMLRWLYRAYCGQEESFVDRSKARGNGCYEEGLDLVRMMYQNLSLYMKKIMKSSKKMKEKEELSQRRMTIPNSPTETPTQIFPNLNVQLPFFDEAAGEVAFKAAKRKREEEEENNKRKAKRRKLMKWNKSIKEKYGCVPHSDSDRARCLISAMREIYFPRKYEENADINAGDVLFVLKDLLYRGTSFQLNKNFQSNTNVDMKEVRLRLIEEEDKIKYRKEGAQALCDLFYRSDVLLSLFYVGDFTNKQMDLITRTMKMWSKSKTNVLTNLGTKELYEQSILYDKNKNKNNKNYSLLKSMAGVNELRNQIWGKYVKYEKVELPNEDQIAYRMEEDMLIKLVDHMIEDDPNESNVAASCEPFDGSSSLLGQELMEDESVDADGEDTIRENNTQSSTADVDPEDLFNPLSSTSIPIVILVKENTLLQDFWRDLNERNVSYLDSTLPWKREYIREDSVRMVKLKVNLHMMLFAGDGTPLRKHVPQYRKNLTALSLSSCDAEKKNDHLLIGLYEGDEDLEIVRKVIGDLLIRLDDHSKEMDHIDENGDFHSYEIHLKGDWKWLNVLLGLYGPSCNHPCPICGREQPRNTEHWDESGTIRDGTEDNCPCKKANSFLGAHFFERVHFDCLHNKNKTTKKNVEITVKKCVEGMEYNGACKEYKDFLVDKKEMDMKNIETSEIQNLFTKYSYPFNESLSLEELIKQINHLEDDLRKRYDSFMKNLDKKVRENTRRNGNTTYPEAQRLARLQCFFYRNKININIIRYLYSENSSMTVIGEYFEKFALLLNTADSNGESIASICGFTNAEVKAMSDMNAVARIYSMKTPSRDNIVWIRDNVKMVCKEYVRIFKIDPYPYLHAASCHMRDDLMKFGTLWYFRCDMVENLNLVMKKIVKNHTNGSRQEENDYIIQTLRRFITRQFCERKYGYKE